MFKKFFHNRAERKLHELYRKGFDYAAGELLRGVDSKKLNGEVAASMDFNNFERGMLDAIRIYTRLKNGQ